MIHLNWYLTSVIFAVASSFNFFYFPEIQFLIVLFFYLL
ncbi:hypothetical protein SOHN41_02703 [Shewanella sp. HN-41]|nr:hypothetical protein SOHN41_02703 [Shewanella sp. HN-41]